MVPRVGDLYVVPPQLKAAIPVGRLANGWPHVASTPKQGLNELLVIFRKLVQREIDLPTVISFKLNLVACDGNQPSVNLCPSRASPCTVSTTALPQKLPHAGDSG